MASNNLIVPTQGYGTDASKKAYNFKISATETGAISGSKRQIEVIYSVKATSPGGYQSYSSPRAWVYVDGSTILANPGYINVKNIWPRGDTIELVNKKVYVEGGQTHTIKGRYNVNGASADYMPATGNKDVSVSLSVAANAPSVVVDGYDRYINSLEIYVHSGNSIAMDKVYATIDGFPLTYILTVDDGKIVVAGLSPQTTYQINLKGYNTAYNTLESTGVNVSYTTSPNAITINSVNINLNNPNYNNDSMDTWTVDILANLSFGNGNSINDLDELYYEVSDENEQIVAMGIKTIGNYTTSFLASELEEDTTYNLFIAVLTSAPTPSDETRIWGDFYESTFTTLNKNKKAWIKNTQGQWIQGDLYIKVEEGEDRLNSWKVAKKIYIKTENGWEESIN